MCYNNAYHKRLLREFNKVTNMISCSKCCMSSFSYFPLSQSSVCSHFLYDLCQVDLPSYQEIRFVCRKVSVFPSNYLFNACQVSVAKFLRHMFWGTGVALMDCLAKEMNRCANNSDNYLYYNLHHLCVQLEQSICSVRYQANQYISRNLGVSIS